MRRDSQLRTKWKTTGSSRPVVVVAAQDSQKRWVATALHVLFTRRRWGVFRRKSLVDNLKHALCSSCRFVFHALLTLKWKKFCQQCNSSGCAAVFSLRLPFQSCGLQYRSYYYVRRGCRLSLCQWRSYAVRFLSLLSLVRASAAKISFSSFSLHFIVLFYQFLTRGILTLCTRTRAGKKATTAAVARLFQYEKRSGRHTTSGGGLRALIGYSRHPFYTIYCVSPSLQLHPTARYPILSKEEETAD